jgi:hypothetical protein
MEPSDSTPPNYPRTNKKSLKEFYEREDTPIAKFVPRTYDIPREPAGVSYIGRMFSEWNRLILTLQEDATLEKALTAIEKPIVIIDSLNFRIPDVFLRRQWNGFLTAQVATNVRRSNFYGRLEAFYSDACYRTRCPAAVGLAVMQFKQPIQYDIQMVRVREFLKSMALQAPQVHFIDVRRRSINLQDFPYFLEIESTLRGQDIPNFSSIYPNGEIYPELDDYMVVALFNILERMGKQVWIHTCDKYRWMDEILNPAQIRSAKSKMVQPFFLNAPTAVLMGYECAYDCTEQQKSAFDYQSIYNPPLCFPATKPPLPL